MALLPKQQRPQQQPQQRQKCRTFGSCNKLTYILLSSLYFLCSLPLKCSSFHVIPLWHVLTSSRSFLLEDTTVAISTLSNCCQHSIIQQQQKEQLEKKGFKLCCSSEIKSTNNDASSSSVPLNDSPNIDKNEIYVEGLLDNLSDTLDKWILSGSPSKRESAFNILQQIKREAMQQEWIDKARRMMTRAGLDVNTTDGNDTHNKKKELGKTETSQRQLDALERNRWESMRTTQTTTTTDNGAKVASAVSSSYSQDDANANNNSGRSALSRRSSPNHLVDGFLSQVDPRLNDNHNNSRGSPHELEKFADDKVQLEKTMETDGKQESSPSSSTSSSSSSLVDGEECLVGSDGMAEARVSEVIARAGSGTAFEGETLGIGGLDDVLSQVKRRVWTPLAAPPKLLEELGIHPVRGLLLYGKPGCGKTLIARKLGQILSPLRPITVVSGPEIMDKFVGSSEKNLREIFDNPPDIYDKFRIGQSQQSGNAIAKAALHVIIMDEFDALARSRGGRGGKGGDQGDAGVARDSVVNQLLAKMDGIDPLIVPTLVIGLTNRRSLIEPALLRPGRFEVQIEVPPPKTTEQRISILKVHTRNMHAAGRVVVRDSPSITSVTLSSSTRYLSKKKEENTDDEGPEPILLTYDELMTELASQCDGMTGAMLAGVARSAASHALERAVEEFTRLLMTQDGNDEGSLGNNLSSPMLMNACHVTQGDFICAIDEIKESIGDSDYSVTNVDVAKGSTSDDGSSSE